MAQALDTCTASLWGGPETVRAATVVRGMTLVPKDRTHSTRIAIDL